MDKRSEADPEGDASFDDEFDDEFAAMKAISATLSPLDQDARSRVLIWATSRFGGVSSTAAAVSAGSSRRVANGAEEVRPSPPTGTAFQHPAELFDAARPKTD